MRRHFPPLAEVTMKHAIAIVHPQSGTRYRLTSARVVKGRQTILPGGVEGLREPDELFYRTPDRLIEPDEYLVEFSDGTRQRAIVEPRFHPLTGFTGLALLLES